MADDGQTRRCEHCGSFRGFEPSMLGDGVVVCRACGLTANEANRHMQDDLAKLFNHNMMLVSPTGRSSSAPPPRANFSISQHYHHSTYTKPAEPATPMQTDAPDSPVFRHLTPAQTRLYFRSLPGQRERLLNLWTALQQKHQRVAMPGISADEMTFEQEEARIADILDPIPTQRSQSLTAGMDSADSPRPEPYMKTGYDILAERDYNQQTPSPWTKVPGSQGPPLATNGLGSGTTTTLSSREWWRDASHNTGQDQLGGSAPIADLMQEDVDMH